MPATTWPSVVHILDLEIDSERQRRAAAVQGAVTRLFDELTRSVEREGQLLARRREAASKIAPGQIVADGEMSPDAVPDVAFRQLSPRTAPMAILQVLTEAGPDGLHGSELNDRVALYGFSHAAVERAKQRLKNSKEISMQPKTRIWTQKPNRTKK